jgi:hypothetical protein
MGTDMIIITIEATKLTGIVMLDMIMAVLTTTVLNLITLMTSMSMNTRALVMGITLAAANARLKWTLTWTRYVRH